MVIGICGYKGSGKSTVADHLVKEHGFTRVNFKDALVAEMKKLLPNTLKSLGEMYSLSVEELFQAKPAVMRALMQEYGTEVRRADDANYWVRQWKETVSGIGKHIVVDDVRFFNELSALTEMDGVLIRIVRSDITSGGEHQSETEQTKFVEDFTIEASHGEHKKVYKAVDDIIATIKSNVD